MTSLQAESPGTQACTNAVNAIRDIIGDLDTTIELVKKGTLHPNNENETFLVHSDTIRKTIKPLAEDIKCFTTGVILSQEQLDVAAQNSASTIIQLAEAVKCGVASLGTSNFEDQVLLINVLKGVAVAVGRLILTAKAAIGKSIDDQTFINMIDSAKVMIRDVISLLETLKSIEDQHSRGACDPESTIEATGQECSFPSENAFKGTTFDATQELIARQETICNESRELKYNREKINALRKVKYGNRSPDEYQENDSS